MLQSNFWRGCREAREYIKAGTSIPVLDTDNGLVSIRMTKTMTIDDDIEDETREPVVEASYDYDVTPPSLAVIEAVAAASNTPASKLKPVLHSIINAEALDNLLKPRKNSNARTSGKLQFTYSDYIVIIDNTSQAVRLYEPRNETLDQ